MTLRNMHIEIFDAEGSLRRKEADEINSCSLWKLLMAPVKTQSIEYSSRFTCARTVHIYSDFHEMPRHDRYALNRRFYFHAENIARSAGCSNGQVRTTYRIDLSDDKNAAGTDFSMVRRVPCGYTCKYTLSYARGNKIFWNSRSILHSYIMFQHFRKTLHAAVWFQCSTYKRSNITSLYRRIISPLMCERMHIFPHIFND